MRGVRDAANDFEGMLCYDEEMCKGVIENIFSKQRSDGWYPRQVPFGSGTKFDLREFVDSACFFTEYVYDYLAYAGDYSILEKKYPYYDDETAETGLMHLKKAQKNLSKSPYLEMRTSNNRFKFLPCPHLRNEQILLQCLYEEIASLRERQIAIRSRPIFL